jgi:hypothetical protein
MPSHAKETFQATIVANREEKAEIALVAGTDFSMSQKALPRGSHHACISRGDLFVLVRANEGNSEEGTGELFAAETD